ncbi:MAG: uroporphyrinogen decarboxylase family protein, partial [Planctomycetota bacterium]
MNSLERVSATLEGRPVDRRPFAAVLSLYGARLTDCDPERYYTDPQAYVDGQTAVLETFGVDILFAPFYLAGLARAWGGTIHRRPGQAPYVQRPAIDCAERIGELVMPEFDTDESLVYIRRAVHGLVDRHGDEVPVVVPTLGPVDLPVLIMGLEAWLETLLFDPEGASRVLEVTTPFYRAWSSCLFREGVTCLVLPAVFLTPSVVTRRLLEKVALPLYRELMLDSEGPVLMHHGGGPAAPFLDAFARLPRTVVGFVVDETDSLSAARTQVGPRRVLASGPAGPSLDRTRPDAVIRRCRQMLESRRHDPSFILCTTGADVSVDAPPAVIH